MLRVLSLTLAVGLLGAGAADASFIVDQLNVPAAGSHFSDGSSVVLPNPANYFTSRTMDDNTPGAPHQLTVSSGALSATLVGGDASFIEWTGAGMLPIGTAVASASFADLELVNFVEAGIPGSIFYDVLLNGVSITEGGVPRALLSNGLLKTDGASIASAADTLRINFTGVGAIGIFTADAIQANPEPMSIGLLGLAMFGGIGRHRKRRRTVA